MRKYILITLLLILPEFTILASDILKEQDFNVIGIQFEVKPEIYITEQIFFKSVEKRIAEAEKSEAKPDLIIFPEYIGVFYQLIDYNNTIFRHNNFATALTDILTKNPEMTSLKDIFACSNKVSSYLENWAELAKKYNTAIIAGSCFTKTQDGEIKNTTFVFNKEGKLIYKQNKVFLTDFEKSIIQLSPGNLSDCSFFNINDHKIAITICRDTYSTEWENKSNGAFLWIDIKANGEVFDNYQRESF
ncbi:MAG: hypothetical protein PQJ46_11740, partial [Spirochaetales bacterium]|nr:hypothetical protein [Spirochaetales bacterium]